MTLQEAEAIKKRCFMGTRAGNRSYDAANALHNEAFLALDFLLREIEALKRGEFICQKCGLRKDSTCDSEKKDPPF
jgi:hypothetical protein